MHVILKIRQNHEKKKKKYRTGSDLYAYSIHVVKKLNGEDLIKVIKEFISIIINANK
jgi:hypothetical protein